LKTETKDTDRLTNLRFLRVANNSWVCNLVVDIEGGTQAEGV